MPDSEVTVPIVNGNTQDVFGYAMGQGQVFAFQFVPRTNSAPVSQGNPMPVADGAAESALTAIDVNQGAIIGILQSINSAEAASVSLLGTIANSGAASAALLGTIAAAESAAVGLLGTIAAAAGIGYNPITPIAPSGTLTLAAAGSSQTLATVVQHGGLIYNPASATQQGVGSAESVFVNITGGAATTSAGAQSFEVLPGSTFPLPALTTSVSWNAASTGHKITASVW